jgi:fructosamine-3-kinase
MIDRREQLGRFLGREIVDLAPVNGGDVAQAYRARMDDGSTVFAKTRSHAPAGFFTTEAAGLAWLRASATVPVPEVICVSDDPPLLVLEWIEGGGPRVGDEADFGRALAAMHASGAPSFGRADRRSTGSRGLPNEPCDTWVEFYADNRLRPLAKLAADARVLPKSVIRDVEAIAERLAQLGGPAEPPARLHGDLWAGNRIVDRAGVAWLIDPAAHGGHREFDLAMMRLFGGFGADCFDAYAEVSPLADGWRDRIRLHQLAPLLVHAIKFGGGYVDATLEAVAALR